ncbi:hypothetical protein N018_01960 [Pseudomonas syringae CC1557]|uniref:Uncharacterized protein n=1 Tax=Pseudomonas syringae CC1557 TaxID=1357279 RepID=W0N1Z9_PSESX|nr:hypothetical protein N018_01960 [Pseudomonas syringae CC1557]
MNLEPPFPAGRLSLEQQLLDPLDRDQAACIQAFSKLHAGLETNCLVFDDRPHYRPIEKDVWRRGCKRLWHTH